jgi:hypothetical protein
MKTNKVTFFAPAIVLLFALFSVLGCGSAPGGNAPLPSEGNDKSVAEYYQEFEDEYWQGRTVTVRSEAPGMLLVDGVEKGRIEPDQEVSLPARILFDGAEITVRADSRADGYRTSMSSYQYTPPNFRIVVEQSMRGGVGGVSRPNNRTMAEDEWDQYKDGMKLPANIVISVRNVLPPPRSLTREELEELGLYY